jgi:hypothetical protein
MIRLEAHGSNPIPYIFLSMHWYTTMFVLDAQIAYEEAMATLFLPESGSILAKTIQVWMHC